MALLHLMLLQLVMALLLQLVMALLHLMLLQLVMALLLLMVFLSLPLKRFTRRRSKRLMTALKACIVIFA
jgi:ABC-type bacteriocin/lantibiotic exporter with double-glycine peptidase domain